MAQHILPANVLTAKEGRQSILTMKAPRASVVFRAAQLSDISSVVDIGTRVYSAAFGHSVEPHQLQAYLDEAYTTEATAAILADPDRDLVVAVSSDNQVCAFGLLTRNTTEACISHLSDTVELQRIYVDSTCHGQGVGGRLAEHLESMAREQGFRHMWLGVWEENLQAQKLYTRLGFKTVGEHDFAVGGITQRDLVMVKTLQ